MIKERPCAGCGRLIEVPANNPHKRFCSPRCRVADWHHHHDRIREDGGGPGAPEGAEPTAEPGVAQAGNGVRDPNVVAGAVPDAEQTPPRCPHCRRPITVVTMLLPPAAAHVTVPNTLSDTGPGDG